MLKSELNWKTGPEKVTISLGNENIEVDFRIVHGIAKNRQPVVFKSASLTKPDDETGQVTKVHKIGESEIFVTYKK